MSASTASTKSNVSDTATSLMSGLKEKLNKDGAKLLFTQMIIPVVIIILIFYLVSNATVWLSRKRPITGGDRFMSYGLTALLVFPIAYLVSMKYERTRDYALAISILSVVILQLIVWAIMEETVISCAHHDYMGTRVPISSAGEGDNSLLLDPDGREYRVGEYYICSSYKSAVPYYDEDRPPIMSAEYLEEVIGAGARFIWLDVFRDTQRKDADPVIAVGKEKGNFIESLNVLSIDEALDAVVRARNRLEGEFASKDPLFIMFSLKTGKNGITEEKLAQKIREKFRLVLLSKEFGSQRTDIKHVPMRSILGKVVIMTDRHSASEKLAELTNYVPCGASIVDEMGQVGDSALCIKPGILGNSELVLSSIDDYAARPPMDQLEGAGQTTAYIVVPNRPGEHYDPLRATFFGVQFPCIHFSKENPYYDSYFQTIQLCGESVDVGYELNFKKYSLIPKPAEVNCEARTLTGDPPAALARTAETAATVSRNKLTIVQPEVTVE